MAGQLELSSDQSRQRRTRQRIQEQSELSAAELEQQGAEELPPREAMSLLEGSLSSGGPSPQTADLLGEAGVDPSTTSEISQPPLPFDNPLTG